MAKKEIQDQILNIKLNNNGDEIISSLINKLNGLRIGYDVQKTLTVNEVIEEVEELEKNFMPNLYRQVLKALIV